MGLDIPLIMIINMLQLTSAVYKWIMSTHSITQYNITMCHCVASGPEWLCKMLSFGCYGYRLSSCRISRWTRTRKSRRSSTRTWRRSRLRMPGKNEKTCQYLLCRKTLTRLKSNRWDYNAVNMVKEEYFGLDFRLITSCSSRNVHMEITPLISGVKQDCKAVSIICFNAQLFFCKPFCLCEHGDYTCIFVSWYYLCKTWLQYCDRCIMIHWILARFVFFAN